jgi:hypothetical protein
MVVAERIPNNDPAAGQRRRPRCGGGMWLAAWCVVAAVAAGVARGDEAITRQSVAGPVEVTTRLEPAEPVIGDTLILTITATAAEGVELLMPEFGEALDRFTIVDFAPRESLDDQGQTVAVQTYRLQPEASGKQSVPPILIEYVDRRPGQRPAPDGYDAYELLTEPIEFEVRSVIPKDATADLQPPLGKLEPRRPPLPSRWPWFLGSLALLAAASPLAIKAFLAWRLRARRRSAYEIAHVRLQRLLAKPRPVSEQVGAFYVELSGIVRRYLEDRFELRAPELTTEEFLAAVGQSPDLSRDHQTLLRGFLRQADLVKFAGVQPTRDDIERSIASAQQFLEETRENAPLLDPVDVDDASDDSQRNMESQ